MKKYIVIFMLVVCILFCFACGKKEEEILHLGLNAEIVDIDAEQQLIFVKDLDEFGKTLFGERTAIDCSYAMEKDNIFFVKYDSEGDLKLIDFDDLLVSDHITLNIYEEELEKQGQADDFIMCESIQLCTQRMY